MLETSYFQPVILISVKHYLLDANQSGFRRGHSNETALLSVTEALWTAKAGFQIISSSFCLDLSAAFDTLTMRLSWPPSHHWASQGFTSLVWILSHWQVLQCGLGGEVSTEHQLVTGVLRDRFLDPLLHIHYITGSHHTGTWLLLPFLCWWHTALSLVTTRWSNGSCKDLRLLGGHLGMDERTPPAAQPGKDWASGLPCHSNSTAWLHDSVRFFNNYPIKFSQKYGCNFR